MTLLVKVSIDTILVDGDASLPAYNDENLDYINHGRIVDIIYIKVLQPHLSWLKLIVTNTSYK